MFWRFSVQQGDYSKQHCNLYLKFAKKVHYKCSHYKNKNGNYVR